MPLEDACADIAIAFMSLQDVDDLEPAVLEIARVLQNGGRFCLAMVHPINSAGKFASEAADSEFIIKDSYLEEYRYSDWFERAGLEMTFQYRAARAQDFQRTEVDHLAFGLFVEKRAAGGSRVRTVRPVIGTVPRCRSISALPVLGGGAPGSALFLLRGFLLGEPFHGAGGPGGFGGLWSTLLVNLFRLLAQPFGVAPVLHIGAEHFQGSAAGIDLIVMGKIGEPFEGAEQVLVPAGAPDLDVAGAALRTERPEPRELVALCCQHHGEAAECAP